MVRPARSREIPRSNRGGSMQLLAQKTFRTGKQSLWCRDGQYYVSIKNRTYSSIQPIPKEKAGVWKKLLS